MRRNCQRSIFPFWAWLFMAWLFAAGPLRAANFYTNYTSATVPWPNGIVPYEFTNTLTTAQQQTYLDGLREWELAANVKFVPHTNQTHWILFDYKYQLSGPCLSGRQSTGGYDRQP